MKYKKEEENFSKSGIYFIRGDMDSPAPLFRLSLGISFILLKANILSMVSLCLWMENKT